jgi:hypothetical protein
VGCLTPPLFIEAHVPSQKNERSYLCALMASILLVSPIFLLDFGILCNTVVLSTHMYYNISQGLGVL